MMNNLKPIEIKSIKHLMAVLGCRLSEVEYIIANKSEYYYTSTIKKVDKFGNIRYDGEGNIEYRILNPSKGRLKEIQTIIKNSILSKIILPTNIKGGVKGNDNIANARVHLGKKYKFKTDIKKYFPSIKYSRVFGLYINIGCSPNVASILTHLTTHKFELPQGTPTSTHIANLIFLPNDLLIIEYCKIHKVTYTRFVDDLVFSSALDFRNKCNEIVDFILKDNFRINY